MVKSIVLATLAKSSEVHPSRGPGKRKSRAPEMEDSRVEAAVWAASSSSSSALSKDPDRTASTTSSTTSTAPRCAFNMTRAPTAPRQARAEMALARFNSLPTAAPPLRRFSNSRPDDRMDSRMTRRFCSRRRRALSLINVRSATCPAVSATAAPANVAMNRRRPFARGGIGGGDGSSSCGSSTVSVSVGSRAGGVADGASTTISSEMFGASARHVSESAETRSATDVPVAPGVLPFPRAPARRTESHRGISRLSRSRPVNASSPRVAAARHTVAPRPRRPIVGIDVAQD